MEDNSKVCQLSYAPAGLYPRVFMSDSSLYVKLLPFSKQRSSISYREINRHHVILNLYDRDVHVVRNTHYIPDESFDFHFNNSIFGRDNIYQREFGLDKVLISAHNGLHELKRDRRDCWRPPNKNIKIMGDSGGAQLRIGTTSYIDPIEVIDWMNDFVDVGAALDIVPRPADMGNRKILWGLAEAQRRCNEIFLERRKSEDLSFINVVHGFNLSDARMWCERVKTSNPLFRSWASGIDNPYSFFDAMFVALTPMFDFADYNGKTSLHFFGTSGKTYVPIFSWLAKIAKIPVTMDSTNYLRGNRYRRYQVVDLRGRQSEIVMGYSAKLGYKTELPCQCPVCYSIKWWEAFNLPGKAKMQHMLTIHNLFTTLKVVKWWNEAAAKSSLEEFKNLVKFMFPIKSTAKGIVDSLDFFECCVAEGLSKTEEKYKNQLVSVNEILSQSSMETLFPGEGPRSSLEDEVSMVGQTFLDSSSRILHRYIPKDVLKKLWKANRIYG